MEQVTLDKWILDNNSILEEPKQQTPAISESDIWEHRGESWKFNNFVIFKLHSNTCIIGADITNK